MSFPNTEAPRRPNLEPLWTQYNNYNINAVPRIELGATPSPAGLSPSPMSPRTLPSPMYPRSSYDGSSMRTQDRALVDSLNHRSRHPSLASPATPASPMTLVPIKEQLPLASMLENVTIENGNGPTATLPPIQWNHGLPSPTSPSLSLPSPSPRLREIPAPPASARQKLYHRPASVAAARGGGQPHLRPQPQHLPRPGLAAVDRRASAPAVPQLASGRGGAASASAIEARNRLRAWGHMYYGNAESAHAFVIARSLGRAKNGGADYRDRPLPSRQTIRAIIRPRAPERQSFLIQRNFDMDQLRATIPDPPPLPPPSSSANDPARPPWATASGVGGRPERSASVIPADAESRIRDKKAVPIREL